MLIKVNAWRESILFGRISDLDGKMIAQFGQLLPTESLKWVNQQIERHNGEVRFTPGEQMPHRKSVRVGEGVHEGPGAKDLTGEDENAAFSPQL